MSSVNEDVPVIRISVRNLVEFILREGISTTAYREEWTETLC